MNTRLSLLTKNVRSVLAASAAFSVMATAPVYAQEAETEARPKGTRRLLNSVECQEEEKRNQRFSSMNVL